MIRSTAGISNNTFQWIAVLAIISVCLLAFVIFECIRLTVVYTRKEQEKDAQIEEAVKARDAAVRDAKAGEETLKSISRDILPPLNAIRTVVSLVSKETMNDETREYCDIIRLSANALAHIAEDVLGLEPTSSLDECCDKPIPPEEEKGKFYIPNARLLVVDDNRVNLKVACALLHTFKCEIIAVDNAYEAIDRIRNGEVFDLILMDHLMPGMDGIEATKHIHALQSDTTMTPVIAMTASTGSDLELSFFKAGMCDFLAKPIVLNQLIALLKKWIPLEKQIFSDMDLISSGPETVFDPQKTLKEFWDDNEIFCQLLNQFLEEGDSIIPLLEANERAGLYDRLRSFSRYAHSIEALSLEMHINALAESLNAPDKDFYISLIRPFKDEYKRVSEAVRQYLNSSLTEE